MCVNRRAEPESEQQKGAVTGALGDAYVKSMPLFVPFAEFVADVTACRGPADRTERAAACELGAHYTADDCATGRTNRLTCRTTTRKTGARSERQRNCKHMLLHRRLLPERLKSAR